MARPLLKEYDGALYHITARGNERNPIYKDDEDRNIFLDVLKLVVETPDGNLSKGMRQLNGVYTQGFNRRPWPFSGGPNSRNLLS